MTAPPSAAVSDERKETMPRRAARGQPSTHGPRNPLGRARVTLPWLVRLRALAGLGEMADRGDFDEFLGNKAACRR